MTIKKSFWLQIAQVLIVIVLVGGLGVSLLLTASQIETAPDKTSIVFNYSALIVKLTAMAMLVFWLIQSFLEQKISLIKSSFWKPLALLVIAVCFSTWINVPINNMTPWLGWGGLWIAIGLLIGIGATILQPKQMKFAFKLLSFWAIVASVLVFLSLTEQLFGLKLLAWEFKLLPTTWLAIFIVFLTGFVVYFIKKGRTPWFQKLLLPFLVLGILSAGTLAYKNPDSLEGMANWRISWQAWQNSWSGVGDESIIEQAGQILFGWGSENYQNFYQLFKPRWTNQSVWQDEIFSQSSLGILTLCSTLGVVGGGALIWLVIKLWQNLFKQLEKGNYFFLMATAAWTIQLLIPLDIILLFLASILLALGLCQRPRREWTKSGTTSSWTSVGLNALGVIGGIGIGLIIWRLIAVARIGAIWREAENNFKVAEASRDEIQLDKARTGLQAVSRRESRVPQIFQRMAIFDLEKVWWRLEQPSLQGADLDLQTKVLNNALFQIKQAINLAPFEAENWLIMGDVYRGTAQISTQVLAMQDEAEKAYRRVIELEPQNNRGWTALGNLFLDKGENERAIEAFKKAIEIQNQSLAANYALAGAYVKNNENSLAYQAYQTTIALLDPALPSYEEYFLKLTQEMKMVEPEREIQFVEDSQLFSQQVGVQEKPDDESY